VNTTVSTMAAKTNANRGDRFGAKKAERKNVTANKRRDQYPQDGQAPTSCERQSLPLRFVWQT